MVKRKTLLNYLPYVVMDSPISQDLKNFLAWGKASTHDTFIREYRLADIYARYQAYKKSITIPKTP